MMTTKTEQNELKQNKAKQNGMKPDKLDKANALNYEIPMSPDEALQCLTEWQRQHRKNQGVTAVGYRVNGGMLMVEVQPVAGPKGA